MANFLDYIRQHDRTQAEWANVFGISRSHFAMIAAGTAQPGKKLMVRIDEITQGQVPVSSWFETSPRSRSDRMAG